MKKWMKLVAVMIVAVMSLTALTACGSGNVTLADIQKKGKITVATSPDFPPFENLENNEIVGIEVDVMNQVAAELGVEIEFIQMDFDSILPAVQAGKVNMGMSGFTVTEERLENADFTMPYFMASQAIVVLADSDIKTKADLEGKTISVQTGTTAEEYCMGEGYDVQSFVANNDAVAALTSGKVDAWVVDNEVAVALSAEQNGKTVVLDEAMTQEPYAFCFRKGSDDLTLAFNEIIDAMIRDGRMQAIFDSYGVPYVAPEM